jgi:hypothetical protein
MARVKILREKNAFNPITVGMDSVGQPVREKLCEGCMSLAKVLPVEVGRLPSCGGSQMSHTQAK